MVLSPNRWSCLPSAFAMAYDVPLQKLLIHVGHDGSKILHPRLREPYCRQSFHIQEMIDFGVDNGFSVTEVQMFPSSVTANDPETEYQIWADKKCINRLHRYLVQYKGVLVGSPVRNPMGHAVYWNGTHVVDPNGTVYESDQFLVSMFFIVSIR